MDRREVVVRRVVEIRGLDGGLDNMGFIWKGDGEKSLVGGSRDVERIFVVRR